MSSSCWSRARRRALGVVLALIGVTLTLGLSTHAPWVALTAIAATSLVGAATCLRQRTRWLAPDPADEIAFGPPPAVVRFADDRPQVFCAGWLRPRLFVSTAALFTLPTEELRAVLGHQRHHARRRDPLRLLAVEMLADSLPFLPVLRPLAERYQRRLESGARARQTVTAEGAVECAFARSHDGVGRPTTAPSAGRALTGWAATAGLAVVALVLHTVALIDLSRVDIAAPGRQLCLIAIVTLTLVGGAIAADRGPS